WCGNHCGYTGRDHVTGREVIRKPLVGIVCVHEGLDASHSEVFHPLLVRYQHVKAHIACTFAVYRERVLRAFCVAHNLLSYETGGGGFDELLFSDHQSAGTCALLFPTIRPRPDVRFPGVLLAVVLNAHQSAGTGALLLPTVGPRPCVRFPSVLLAVAVKFVPVTHSEDATAHSIANGCSQLLVSFILLCLSFLLRPNCCAVVCAGTGAVGSVAVHGAVRVCRGGLPGH